MDDRDRFLVDVWARLTLPEPARREVLQELADHLDDVSAGLVERGLAPSEAAARALDRLGRPAELAAALSRAHRPRARALYAARAGVWAIVRDGFIGSLLAWFLLLLAFAVGQMSAAWLGNALNLNADFSWGAGWNSVLTALGLHGGALFAGAAAVRAAALAGWRSRGEVRIPVAVAGGAAVAWGVIFLLHQQLNWTSVVAMSLVPVSFVMGTLLDRLRVPSPRAVAAGLLAIGFVVFGGMALLRGAIGGSPDGFSASYSWDARTHGYEMVGPVWQGSLPGDLFDAVSEGWAEPGAVQVTLTGQSSQALAPFGSFRLEAWAAQAPQDGWRLLPGQTAPIAWAPATRDGTDVTGALSLGQHPGVQWAQVVLTGVYSDGTRYVLWSSSPERVVFDGSVWDWFRTLGR